MGRLRLRAHHEARLLVLPTEDAARREIERVGADPAGAAIMAAKCRHAAVKLTSVPAAAAHILKETFLSHGGDAAVHKDLVRHQTGVTDVILMGSLAQFRDCLISLRKQPATVVTDLAVSIETALTRFDGDFAVPCTGSERVRKLFSAMRERTAIMGIVNVTPDSFSDGGELREPAEAVAKALRMIEDGADVIDVGGESTRPGAEPVALDEELARVIPVIAVLRQKTDAVISIDTYKSKVALAAIEAGADMVNDITGLGFDPEMAPMVAEKQSPIIIMHIKGTPRDMQIEPAYDDLMAEVFDYLRDRLGTAIAAGVNEDMVMVDPGFGFGKTAEHNLEIVRRLRELTCMGRPVVLGPSRKATIGKILGDLPPKERVEGTGAMVALAIANGASMVRVHDVKAMARAAKVADAVCRA